MLVAASTGLRQSELFGLKWGDIDFAQNSMSVTRSIVCGVVGPCKTESSQKLVPVHPTVLETLGEWKQVCPYNKPDDWVFASRQHRGRKPIWGQAILRRHIRPVASRAGIQKQFGWHTFRHYSACGIVDTRTRLFFGVWGQNSKSCKSCCDIPRYVQRWMSTRRRSHQRSTLHKRPYSISYSRRKRTARHQRKYGEVMNRSARENASILDEKQT